LTNCALNFIQNTLGNTSAEIKRLEFTIVYNNIKSRIFFITNLKGCYKLS